MTCVSGTNKVASNLKLNIDLANQKTVSNGVKKDLISRITLNEVNGVGITYDNQGEWVFDGVNDYVGLGSSAFDLTQEETTIAWVNPLTVSSSYRARIGNRHGGFLTCAGSQFGYEGMNNSGVWGNNHYTSSNTLKENIWQQIAFTFKADDRVDLYYNGSYITGKAVVGSQTSSSIEFQIGTEITGGWGSPPYFSGKIGTILLYDRKLTVSEIKQNFEATRSRYNV